MLKFLGVGLGRTGTLSLHRAMQMLGFRSAHWEPQLLRDVILGPGERRGCRPTFRRYDHLDFICDLPHALFYPELAAAYPNLKFILTVRDTEAWYRSIVKHRRAVWNPSRPDLAELAETYKLAYGSDRLDEFLYKRRYEEWNRRVIASLSPLVLDITRGDGWQKLCEFVRKPIPKREFPHENRSLS